MPVCAGRMTGFEILNGVECALSFVEYHTGNAKEQHICAAFDTRHGKLKVSMRSMIAEDHEF